LFIRGLDRFTQRDPGWRVDGLITGNLSLPEKKYATPAQGLPFIQQLEEKMAAIPGVESAALAWSLPVWGFSSSAGFVVEDRPAPERAETPLAYVNGVTPGYFETLGMRRLQGRDFNAADDTNSPAVIIINETMARHFWPGESPIGKRIGNPAADDRDWREIVGVVSDVRFAANFSQPDTRFQIYKPLAQEPRGFLVAALRSAGPTETLASSLRVAVAQIDSDQPVYEAGSARQLVERILKNYTLTGWLLASFAGLGLLLAGVGIYGMIAGFVTQRTGEIGIRMALGAQLRNVLWLVLGQGLRLAGWGTAIGLTGAFALARLLAAVAPELPASEPMTIVSVAGLLIAVALVACWLPARRAARVNPMTALRME
jgi:predicted permease